MDIKVKYVDAKKGIIERTKDVHVEIDADMAEVYRFLKSTIPKCEAIIYMNLRVVRGVASEFSMNARVTDVLKNGAEYFLYYSKEETVRDTNVYTEVKKYVFFESGADWVKVQVELEGVGSLKKEDIIVDFGPRSLELRVMGLKGVNYKLRVNKTHHPYNNEKSKFLVKENKIILSLFKRKQDDHWFSLQKQNMIGETLDEK